eukprot:m.131314 g.131314  ORF g.131314 m.131314 type:complete len:56 (-) comp14622_c2_seq2:33-200(-)
MSNICRDATALALWCDLSLRYIIFVIPACRISFVHSIQGNSVQYNSQPEMLLTYH